MTKLPQIGNSRRSLRIALLERSTLSTRTRHETLTLVTFGTCLLNLPFRTMAAGWKSHPRTRASCSKFHTAFMMRTVQIHTTAGRR